MLVVFAIGSIDPKLLGIAKRAKAYRPDDYGLLVAYIDLFDEVILLPNTLTEAANLLAQTKEGLRDDCLLFLAALAQGTEQYVASAIATAEPEYIDLGLTDAAILHILDCDTYLLTADRDLHVAALCRSLDAQLFEHLRD